jgi:hypothetical protein
MQDHVVQLNSLYGGVDLNSNLPFDILVAQADLYGQVKWENHVTRYKISIPVRIENGTLIQWDLDRKKLTQFLEELFSHTFVRKAMSIQNAPILTLWYAESPASEQGLPNRAYGFLPRFDYQLESCSSFYQAVDLPNNDLPLRGFGFNRKGDAGSVEFLLLKGQIIPVSIYVSAKSEQKELAAILTPSEFLTGDSVPFGNLELVSNAFVGSKVETFIAFRWDANSVTENGIENFNDLISKVPGSRKTDDTRYIFENSTIMVSSQGSLHIQSCSP